MEREARIAELRGACGCKEGLLALVLGVAAYVLRPDYFPASETTLGTALVGAAVGLGCAVAGKLAGLLVAHVKLRRLLRGAG